MSHKGTAVTVKSSPFASRTKVNPATSKGTKVVIRDAQVVDQEYVNGVTVSRRRDSSGSSIVSTKGGGGRGSGKAQQAQGETTIKVLDGPGGKVISQGVVHKSGQYSHRGGNVKPDGTVIPDPAALKTPGGEVSPSKLHEIMHAQKAAPAAPPAPIADSPIQPAAQKVVQKVESVKGDSRQAETHVVGFDSGPEPIKPGESRTVEAVVPHSGILFTFVATERVGQAFTGKHLRIRRMKSAKKDLQTLWEDLDFKDFTSFETSPKPKEPISLDEGDTLIVDVKNRVDTPERFIFTGIVRVEAHEEHDPDFLTVAQSYRRLTQEEQQEFLASIPDEDREEFLRAVQQTPGEEGDDSFDGDAGDDGSKPYEGFEEAVDPTDPSPPIPSLVPDGRNNNPVPPPDYIGPEK